MKNNKILFISSFLSSKRGSLDVTESIIKRLEEDNIPVLFASSFENKILRLLHIICKIIFSKYETIHISVYSGSGFNISIVSSFLAKLKNKKIILTLHGGRLNEFYEENPKKIERVFKRANTIITPSKFLQKYFINKGYTIDHLPNSLDLEKFQYNRENIIDNSILWVRAFDEIYNPYLAVKIIYEVRKTIPNAKLTMIGPDRGILKDVIELIKLLNIENAIEIVGPVKNDCLFKYYQTHKIFINTTKYESFGVALFEAASCGVPIVTNNIGEIPYIWQNNSNILLVDSGDEKEFARKIIELMSNSHFYNNISVEGCKNAKLYEWSKIKTSLYNIFDLNEKKTRKNIL